MQKPLIQIDDVVREMTDAEFLEYEKIIHHSSEPQPEQ